MVVWYGIARIVKHESVSQVGRYRAARAAKKKKGKKKKKEKNRGTVTPSAAAPSPGRRNLFSGLNLSS